MRLLLRVMFLCSIALIALSSYGQKPGRELYIPMDNGGNIKMTPRLDTLENKREYEFRIKLAPEYKVSQFLFEGGLAVQNDSVLVISATSRKNGGIDTATLRVIVTSVGGSRIWPFQKDFIIKVEEKSFPIIKTSRSNVVMVNDKVVLERNSAYAKDLLVANHPFMTMYDNATNMNKMEVKEVTVALMQKEGKQYISKGDTLSSEAIHEIKKIKKPTPVYIKVEGQSGKSRKAVWERIVVYNE